MSIISQTFGLLGQNDVIPRRVQLVVTDGLTEILLPGYLTQNGINPYSVYTTDIFDIIYAFSAETNTGTYGEFTCTVSLAGIITLIPANVVWAKGTFTPVFTFGTPGNLSVVYTTQTGMYWTIGQLKYIYVVLKWTPTFTTSSGIAYITGIPALNYSSDDITVSQTSASITFPAGVTQITGSVANSNSISFLGIGSAIDSVNFMAANFTSGMAHVIVLSGINIFLK